MPQIPRRYIAIVTAKCDDNAAERERKQQEVGRGRGRGSSVYCCCWCCVTAMTGRVALQRNEIATTKTMTTILFG